MPRFEFEFAFDILGKSEDAASCTGVQYVVMLLSLTWMEDKYCAIEHQDLTLFVCCVKPSLALKSW